MKKNIDTRNGRYESPFRPRLGRRTWSRTARMASSPRFCTPRGTSFGRRNAAQKNAITTSAATIASSIGLVKPNEPIVKKGFQLKSCKPGAGNPHPLKMWHPPLARTLASPVTGHLLPWPLRHLLPAKAVDDVAERDAQADEHADREEHRDVHGPPDQPADNAIGGHAGQQVADHVPAGFQPMRPALRRGLLLTHLGGGFAASLAHVIRPAVLLAEVDFAEPLGFWGPCGPSDPSGST